MLSERQKTVLEVIVSDYTKSGVPVGSKALSNQLPIHVSSATVRNDMAYLEKVGLISKTHSSSGRIPSIEGYRYYVDNLLNPNPIDNSDIRIIKTALGGNFGKIDEIVEQSANILSNLTSYTALALKPEQQVSRRLRSFQLVPLGDRQVMAILITDSQDVINQIFHISDDIHGEQLDAVVRLINDEMVGKHLSDILKSLLKGDFTKKIVKYINDPKGILATFNNILTEASKNQFYIGGELNLLSFTDNNDISYLKPIYSLLNDTDDISQFINNSGKSISVKIGPEISNSLLKDYSVITGTYDVGEYGKGVVAVLGPTRMPYSRIIGIVESFRDELSKKLLNYYNKYDQ